MALQVTHFKKICVPAVFRIHNRLITQPISAWLGVWIIQTINQNTVTIEATDLAAAIKKNVIHVLHVDDDPSVQEITKLMLLDLDSSFDIDNACCVDEAFKKLATGKYDVVVSDYEMPQKDGLEFLKELREQHNKIPFILFTGKGREEVAIRALNLGVDGYYNKQGSPETVYGELCYGIIQTVDHKQDQEALIKNETALRRSEEQYRAYTENSPVAFFVVNPEGRYVQVNDAATKLLFYSKNELLKMSIVDILFEKDVSFGLKQLATLKETGKSRFETALKRKDGEPVYVILNATRLPNGNMMAFCENITERKKAEQELKEREAKYYNFFNNSEVGMFRTRLDGSEVFDFNDKYLTMLGLTREEVKGKPSVSFWADPHQREEMFCLLKANGQVKDFECRLLNKKHEIIQCLTSAKLYPEQDIIEGSIIDITQLKKAEEKLQLDEERLRLAQGISQVGIWDFDVSSGELFWDEVICRISGVSFELKPSLENFFKIVHPADLEFVKESIQGALEGKPFDIEMRILRPDGSERVVNSMGELKGNSQGKPKRLFGIVQDITERKKTEESFKLQAALIDISPSAIIIKNTEEIIKFWSQGAEKLYGYTKDEALGQTTVDLLKAKYPRPVNEIFCELQQGKHWIEEVTHYTKENKEIVVQTEWLAILDNERKITDILESNIDITMHKRAEEEALRKAEERYLKAERLAAIGQLAGMVGHDLRNPLAGIKNAVYLLRKKQGNFIGESGIQMLNTIEQAVVHSDSIISDLLDYSRELHLQVEEYSSKSLINYVILSMKIPKNIKIIQKISDQLIWVDGNKIQRVFVNLIKNSFDAMPNGGQLEISSNQNGENVSFIFADTGIGMPEEVLAKLFTPLFTTKAQGMGLGLAICRRFIEAHNGKISVQSFLNKGTTFLVSLPIQQKYAVHYNEE